jgi:hypothetical protein
MKGFLNKYLWVNDDICLNLSPLRFFRELEPYIELVGSPDGAPKEDAGEDYHFKIDAPEDVVARVKALFGPGDEATH